MKKGLIILAAAMVMVGCGSKQVAPTKGEVEVKVPCSEFKTDKNTLRANASAISPNMQNAKEKALLSARKELATSIEATIKRVVDQYASSYDLDDAADFRGKVQDITRTVVNQQLVGSVPVCEEVTKSADKDGKTIYHAYVAIELTTNEMLEAVRNGVSKISEEEKLRTDFEYEKFKKTFEEEMSKLGE